MGSDLHFPHYSREKWGQIFTFYICLRSHRCRVDSLIGAPLLMARESNAHSNGVELKTENREQRTENREQRTENREQRSENRRPAVARLWRGRQTSDASTK